MMGNKCLQKSFLHQGEQQQLRLSVGVPSIHYVCSGDNMHKQRIKKKTLYNLFSSLRNMDN